MSRSTLRWRLRHRSVASCRRPSSDLFARQSIRTCALGHGYSSAAESFSFMLKVLFPRALCSFLTLCSLIASPLHAQYFGRNKVQYRTFDFQILKTEHFDIYFYPGEQGAANQAARMAERWLWRLSTVFSHQLSGRQPLILYASPIEFQQTNAIGGDICEGTGGVT